MGHWHTARDIYLAVKDDSDSVAQIRKEQKRLAGEIATEDNGGLDLTSATVNGQSYAGARSITKVQRLRILSNVLRMVDANAVPSSRTTPLSANHGHC